MKIRTIINIALIIGWIVAVDNGFGLWYILITTLVICIIYIKQIIKAMKEMGDYFEWMLKPKKPLQ